MKKQGQKKNNPFKVNQIRKIKAKAKPFKGQLKNLKDILNNKVHNADEDLKALGEIVRQAPATKPTQEKPKPMNNPSNSEIIQKYETMEKNTDDALKKLECWSCDK